MVREHYWDNAKLVLVALVAVTHVLLLYVREDRVARILYLGIMLFLMPAFAFVSGALSKASTDGPWVRRLVARLAVPYVVFHFLYGILRWRTSDPPESLLSALSHNQYALWFLACLLAWRLALPFLAAIPGPWLLAGSIAASVGSGYVPSGSHDYVLRLAVVFLPFFVAGHLTGRRVLAAPRRSWLTAAAIGLVAGGFGLAWALDDLSLTWIWGGTNYAGLGRPEWYAGAYRLLLMAAAIVLGLAVLALIPTGAGFAGDLGRRTMYPYLLHVFGVRALAALGVTGAFHSTALRYALVLLAIPFVGLLAWEPVTRVFRPVVEPFSLWQPRGGKEVGVP